MSKTHEILIKNGYLQLPALSGPQKVPTFSPSVATVVANMAYYGYTPNAKGLEHLMQMSHEQLFAAYDQFIKPALDVVSGASKKMDDFVVYKNFPKEVLDMSAAQYWFSQICMYIGFDNEYFTQDVKERAPLRDDLKLKVLQLAPANVFELIYGQLKANKARWTDDQRDHAKFLSLEGTEDDSVTVHLHIGDFGFKENGIELIGYVSNQIGDRFSATIPDATDVLRLASVLSGGDAGLRVRTKFKSFNRPLRKLLVNVLENSKNLEDDFAARADAWKKLLMRLHPGDFDAPRVQAAYNTLYTDDYTTFNSNIEVLLASVRPVKRTAKKNRTVENKALADKLAALAVQGRKTDNVTDQIDPMTEVVRLLSQRPGVFVRRFHEVARVFNYDPFVIDGFLAVADKLSVSQLVKLDGYLRTINSRKHLTFAPKGNWAKLKFVANDKTPIPTDVVVKVRSYLQGLIANRMSALFPEGVKLDFQTMDIKLQSNDQELAPYGRGTVFEIPKNMTFLRSASYWARTSKSESAKKGYTYGGYNSWFDNGWNFFDEKWEPLGACCWSAYSYPYGYSYYGRNSGSTEAGAVFSGDPTNSKDLHGRACQMIDLYIDKLAAAGVRYAVWNILAYSRIEFADYDVMGTLQWGEDASSGNLYEPSRAQMVFPLKGKSLTKFVAYVDVVERKLVYMDVGFGVSTSTAASNTNRVAKLMPAYVEYLDSIPSVADLFAGVKPGETPILYSDAEDKIEGGKAYVFRPENPANHFDQIDVIKLLG